MKKSIRASLTSSTKPLKKIISGPSVFHKIEKEEHDQTHPVKTIKPSYKLSMTRKHKGTICGEHGGQQRGGRQGPEPGSSMSKEYRHMCINVTM